MSVKSYRLAAVGDKVPEIKVKVISFGEELPSGDDYKVMVGQDGTFIVGVKSKVLYVCNNSIGLDLARNWIYHARPLLGIDSRNQVAYRTVAGRSNLRYWWLLAPHTRTLYSMGLLTAEQLNYLDGQFDWLTEYAAAYNTLVKTANLTGGNVVKGLRYTRTHSQIVQNAIAVANYKCDPSYKSLADIGVLPPELTQAVVNFAT